MTVGFNPPGPHFCGVRAETQMCPKHFFYTFFCLAVSRDFAKNAEIRGFLDVEHPTTLKFTQISCFAMVETALYTGFCVALRLVCSLMGSEESFETPLFTRLCHFSHPRACKLVFGLGIHLTSLSLFQVPSSEQSAVLGLRAILRYKKWSALGRANPTKKKFQI